MCIAVMKNTNTSQFNSADRALVIINDVEIHRSTRLQKYGFLLSQQYKKELSKMALNCPDLKFYTDWEAFWYGPFSKSLQTDVNTCVENKLIRKTLIDQNQNSYKYALTIKGRLRWRKILDASRNEVSAIHEKVSYLQTMRLERLLEGIYYAYPNYTKHSTIKGRFK